MNYPIGIQTFEVIRKRNFAYVDKMKLKRDKNPDDALDQIDDKGYVWPYQVGRRKVIKIGASFSSTDKTLVSWTID